MILRLNRGTDAAEDNILNSKDVCGEAAPKQGGMELLQIRLYYPLPVPQ